MMTATVEHQSGVLRELVKSKGRYRSGVLRELVRGGADLNLQNEVRYTVTVATALHHVSSPAVHIRRV